MAKDGRWGIFLGISMVALCSLPIVALYTFMSVKLGEDFFIPTMIVGGIVTAIVLRGPVGRALARRIEGEGVVPPDVLGEVDEVRQRMLELEERLDFAERMMARPRETERVIE